MTGSHDVAVQPRADAIRPLRSDAAQNLLRIRQAALDTISEHGTEASMEQIATRAGVGVGTLYRRFPNKDALIDALVEQIQHELVDAARTALAREDGAGLVDFLRAVGRAVVAYHGCAAELFGRRKSEASSRELRDLYAQLTDQARAHGQIADHVTVGDVQATIWALRGVIDASSAAPAVWERFLDLQLAGLMGPRPQDS